MSDETRPDEFVPGSAPKHAEDEVAFGKLWKHYRGDYYLTVGLSRQSTNGPDDGRREVVYHSISTRDAEAMIDFRLSGPRHLEGVLAGFFEKSGELANRKASEFLDGRWQPVKL